MKQARIEPGTVYPSHRASSAIFTAAGGDRFSEAGMWRAVLDASSDCIALLEDDGCLLWVNARAQRELDNMRGGAVVGRSLPSLWPRGQRAGMRAALRSARRGRTGCCTVRVAGATDAVRWWHLSVLPIAFGADLPIRLITVAREVTERHTALENPGWTTANDPPTDLGNRTSFYSCVDRLCGEGDGQSFGILGCDLDAFEPVIERSRRGGIDAMLQRRAQMIGLTRKAVVEGRIVPWYQPKIDLQTGRIVGFEALLRWRDTAGRIRCPGSLIEAFDDPMLGRKVTATMLDKIIDDLCKWQARGIQLPVAVNVTADDLADETFASNLLSRLDIAGVSPERLEIEITETIFLDRNVDHIQALLRELNTAGVRIALDDFGTGYASLVHLKQFPVDVLKIDRRFIQNLHGDPDDQAIVEAMIRLADSLSMEVVAEGVEHAADAEFLRTRGCALGQGFLFGKPMPARAVLGLLARAGQPIVHATHGNSGRTVGTMIIQEMM